ncbi:MAG TPA: hypothetical protein VFG69_02070 [Nannocystaceae bacterium]|nr:hypothetical protein [Nannocystaceae bacterium]
MRAFHRPSPGLVGIGVALTVWTTSTAALAEQVVVFDQTWVHTPELPDSHYRLPPDAGTPADWTSPVDYSQGSAWVYLEVHTKPTDQETKFQVCFEATPTYACTAQSPTYTEVGVYEWETPFTGFWSPPGEYVDWTLGVHDIACILKDTMNGKPSADNVGPEVASLYTPTEVRLVVTLVEAGGVYEPPVPTGASTGTDGGSESEGSESDGGDEGGGSTSTSGDDATATNVDDGPAEETGPATASAGDSATADASSSDGGTAQDGDDDDANGCACATDRVATRGWLAVLGLVLVRRRRGRSTTGADPIA